LPTNASARVALHAASGIVRGALELRPPLVARDDAERPRPARLFHVHAIADGERVRVPAVG